MKTFISNRPGTVAIAHGIGVNGNSDIFINLEDYGKAQQTCNVGPYQLCRVITPLIGIITPVIYL